MINMILPFLIMLAILGLVIAIIVRPLYTMKSENVSELEQKKTALNTEYQQTLSRIRELEQEHLEGKLGDDDYQDRRSMLNNEAVVLLKQLEDGFTDTP